MHGKAHLLLFIRVLCDEAAVKIEVESSLILHLALLLLVVLEDALVDLHVARLPSAEQRRAVLVE